MDTSTAIKTKARTETKATPTVDRETRQHVDFETRLTLASAAMDAVIAHRHGPVLEEAQAAVQAAEKEALKPEPWAPTPANSFRPTPNRILAKAARTIEQRGWHKGSWSSAQGAVCALRAIQLAADCDDRAAQDAVHELLNRIAVELGRPGVSVNMWNDGRSSREDVLKLLW